MEYNDMEDDEYDPLKDTGSTAYLMNEWEKEKKAKEEKTTLPMLRFGSNSVRITEDELVMLSNRYNEYVECTPDEGFITWLLKRGL